MKHDDRQDAPFRYLIAASQLGDLARYTHHDSKLSPSARKHGSPAEERLSFGHAYVQLTAFAHSRGLTAEELEQAVDTAMKAIEDREWTARKAKTEQVQGMTAHPGIVEGEVFVLNTGESIASIPSGKVLVTRYGGPELVQVMGKVIAIVTDDGGAHSHLALLSREHKVPCIMGTGNATARLTAGQRVRVHARPDRGQVELLPPLGKV